MAKQYLLAQAGDNCYGIDLCVVDNVIRVREIARVPQSQAYYKGVLNLRGDIIAVMSIRLRMGFADDVLTEDSRIVILNQGEKGHVGMLVDKVKGIETFETPLAAGIAKNGEEEISLLDLKAIFAETENMEGMNG